MGVSIQLLVKASVVALTIATQPVQLTVAAGRGPAGAKGDPGANAMAIGLFTQLAGINVPLGTDLVRTTGYSRAGRGGAFYIATANTGATAYRVQTANGRWFELNERIVYPEMFGAQGDCTAQGQGTDDSAAINTFFGYVLNERCEGSLAPSQYRCSAQLSVDYQFDAVNAPQIIGAGPHASQFVFDVGVASPNMLISATNSSAPNSNGTALFYARIGGFSVHGNCPGGTVLQIGAEQFQTAWNGLEWGSLVVNNDSATDNSTALECNGMYSCRMFGVVTANCGGRSTSGTTDHGLTTAVRLRRYQFSEAYFAVGNAYIGFHLAEDYTFGNTFGPQDAEVLNEYIRSDSNANKNNFVGGTVTQVEYLFNCAGTQSVGAGLHCYNQIYGAVENWVRNPNAALGDPSWGGQGVTIHDASTIYITPPNPPAASTWVQNRTLQPMKVYLSLPTGTTVFARLYYDFSSPGLTVAQGINNEQMIELEPGDQISWTGQNAPSWAWLPTN